MPTAQDIVQQKQQAQKQIDDAKALAQRQKDLIRKQIADYESQISNLNALKAKAQADLSRLG